MVRQPRQGTKPENRLFEALAERGIDFARNVKPVEGFRRELDGCLEDEKVAVFVDGCFWHGCPIHSRATKSNTLWWREKIDGNKARDAETDETLRSLGWLVLRVWEHEDPAEAAESVARSVEQLRAATKRRRGRGRRSA
jgi:DNA mismatch endonuclease (patch repair protein)